MSPGRPRKGEALAKTIEAHDMLRAYEAGERLEEIAARYGLGTSAVHERITRASEINAGQRKVKVTPLELMRANDSGISQGKLARYIGYSQTRVQELIKQARECVKYEG